MKQLEKLTSALKHEDNPYLKNLAENHIQVKVKSTIISSENIEYADTKNGEIVGGKKFHTVYKDVDPESFAKIYLNKMKEIFSLSSQSYKLLGYILHNVRPNKAEFYIYPHQVMAYTKWKSKRSVYMGIVGLINANIIANSIIPSLYYINPVYVFNGDRLICVTEWRKMNPIKMEMEGDVVEGQKLLLINKIK